jgi:hypothetical protein
MMMMMMMMGKHDSLTPRDKGEGRGRGKGFWRSADFFFFSSWISKVVFGHMFSRRRRSSRRVGEKTRL